MDELIVVVKCTKCMLLHINLGGVWLDGILRGNKDVLRKKGEGKLVLWKLMETTFPSMSS